MMPQRLRLAYLSRVPHPAFLEAAAADPALEVVRLSHDMGDAAILEALRGCRGYYVARRATSCRSAGTSRLVSSASCRSCFSR